MALRKKNEKSSNGSYGVKVKGEREKLPLNSRSGVGDGEGFKAVSDTQYLYIVFELVRIQRNVSDGVVQKVEIVEVNPLAVLPSQISYRYSSRNIVEQTAERAGRVSAYRDVHGRGLTEVTISGSFGQGARMHQEEMKSGWDRLYEFRERVFKASLGTTGEIGTSKAVARQEHLGDFGNAFIGDNYDEVIYVINYYDFINEEQFSVDLSAFDINASTDFNNLPQYTLTLKEVGPVVSTAEGSSSNKDSKVANRISHTEPGRNL